LYSFTVFKQVYPKNYFCRIFNIKLWKEVTEAQWWPTKNGNCFKVGKIEDEYENMFVKDQKDIMVSIPGRIDFCEYKFLVKTSNGGQILYTTIDGFRNYFSRRFEQRRWLFGHRLFASDRGGFVERGRNLPPPTI
jgi:hypothetical protein